MHNIEAMTPVQPGAYIALFENRETGEIHKHDVVAITAHRVSGGWIEFKPLCSNLETPRDSSIFINHGMFAPDEVEEYIAEIKFSRADREATEAASEDILR